MKKLSLGILLLLVLSICVIGLATAEDALPITPGITTTEISLPGEIVIYSYKPTKAGVYQFYSSYLKNDAGEDIYYDTYGYLLDEDMQIIRYNDDGGEQNNFFLVYQLEANTQYYFAARMFSGRNTGAFNVHLVETEGVYATAQSVTVYADYNTTGTLKVNAFTPNGGLTYQWYQVVGETEQLISGATTAQYTFPAITEIRQYKCTVKDSANSSSDVYFQAMIDCGISATFQRNIYVDLGGTAELQINVTAKYGADQLTYQWYGYDENGNQQMIDGATTNSLTLSNVTVSGEYFCRITDANGQRHSYWFELHVRSGLTASAQGSSDYEVPYGNAQTLTVTAQSNVEISRYYWVRVDKLFDDEEYVAETTVNSYTIPSVISSGEYRCYVYDAANNNTSVLFKITAVDSFSAEPDGSTSYTVTAGQSCTLGVNATSTYGEIAYQWYCYNKTFEQKTPIKGATARTYTISGVTSSSEFYCLVSDTSGNQQEISFHVSFNNRFSARRVSDYTLYLNPGEEGTLEVSASCTAGRIFYRWIMNKYYPEGDYFNEEPVDGAKGPSLTVTGTGIHTEYRCIVSDQYGNSQTIWFEVAMDNEFSAERIGNETVTITAGGNASFAVIGHCKLGSVKYQWYRLVYDEEEGYNYSESIPGETQSTLNLTNLTLAGEYECRVSDEYGNSEWFWFRVIINNDLIANPLGDREFTIQPGGGVTMGVTASCLVGDVSYQWYREIMINENGETYWTDEKINGATNYQYAPTGITQATNYYCRVSDQFGNNVNVWFYVSIDNQLTAVAIGDTSITIEPNESITLEVTASCLVGEVSYQWYREFYVAESGSWRNELISDAIDPTYTVQSVNSACQYYCRVSDQYNNREDVWFDISIDNQFTAERLNNDENHVISGGSVTLGVRASCTTGEINYIWYMYTIDSDGDWNNGQRIATDTDTYTAENITEETGFKCRVSDAYGNNRSFDFRVIPVEGFFAEADGPTYIYVDPEASATMKVRAFSDEGEITYTWYDSDYNLISDAVSNSWTIEYIINNTEYHCFVTDGINQQTIYFYIRIDTGFTVQRVNKEVAYLPAGTTETLEVNAAARFGELTYQWTKDGSDIENATESTLSISGIDGGHRYECQVNGSYGYSTSVAYLRFAGTLSALTLNETKSVSITETNQLVVCSFVPSETKTYYFSSTVNRDTYGYLFDAGYNELTRNDDDGIGNNFLIARTLNAGQTYYLGIRYYDIGDIGTIDVKVSDNKIQKTENIAFTMRVGQSLKLESSFEGSNFSRASADDTDKISISSRTVSGLSAGTVTVTAEYGEYYAIVYTVTIVNNQGVLKLPSGLTVIEEDAFSGDTSVRFVELGNNVSTIESGAFSGTNLVQIIIPSNYTDIYNGAFGACTPTIVCPRYSNAWDYAESYGLTHLPID